MAGTSGNRGDTLPLAAVFGIVGPIMFTMALLSASLLEPDFDHTTQLMSDLGSVRAAHPYIMNVGGFIVPGMMILFFAFGLHWGINGGQGSRLGPALMGVAGMGLIASGLFPSDTGPPPRAATDVVHTSVVIPTILAQILGPLALYPRLRRDPHWRGLGRYTLATCCVAAVAAGLMLAKPWLPWQGAFERAFALVVFLWTEVMAIRLLLLGRHLAWPIHRGDLSTRQRLRQ